MFRSPHKSKEDAIRDIVQQLQESQTREAEMFQQAEDMQVSTLHFTLARWLAPSDA